MRDATLIQPLGSDGDPVTDSLIVDRDTMVKRRDVLCGGGAAAFATLVSSLLIRSRPTHAAALLPGAVPTVDRLTVVVVTDSYQLAVAPSSTMDMSACEKLLGCLDWRYWGASDIPYLVNLPMFCQPSNRHIGERLRFCSA
jgi:hypothetical protein